MFIIIAICWIALFIALGIWMMFDRKDDIQALKDLDYYLTFDPEDEDIIRVRKRMNVLKKLAGFMACIDFGFCFLVATDAYLLHRNKLRDGKLSLMGLLGIDSRDQLLQICWMETTYVSKQ